MNVLEHILFSFPLKQLRENIGIEKDHVSLPVEGKQK